MTANVIDLLDKLKDLELFERYPLYFVGGTAMAYYLNHRISEDIDIVGTTPLPYCHITETIMALGGIKLKDANAMALRLAGLFPDEHILKFNLDGTKLEFFAASHPLQKEIIRHASSQAYHNGKLKIVDLSAIAKLKLVALFNRRKSRDLYDFTIVLETRTLTDKQILEVASKMVREIDSIENLYKFIQNMQVAEDDEIVYLDENDPQPLEWDLIHQKVLRHLRNL